MGTTPAGLVSQPLGRICCICRFQVFSASGRVLEAPPIRDFIKDIKHSACYSRCNTSGQWTYLYRAVDSTGETIDFLLSPKRDALAAKQFLQMAMWRVGGIRPRVINVDGHAAYPQAIRELKASGELSRQCACRPTPYLNNVLEQDHRFVKKRVAASLWFRSIEGALRTIGGYEAMNMIRKGQIRWLAKGDVLGQAHYIEQILGVAA